MFRSLSTIQNNIRSLCFPVDQSRSFFSTCIDGRTPDDVAHNYPLRVPGGAIGMMAVVIVALKKLGVSMKKQELQSLLFGLLPPGSSVDHTDQHHPHLRSTATGEISQGGCGHLYRIFNTTSDRYLLNEIERNDLKSISDEWLRQSKVKLYEEFHRGYAKAAYEKIARDLSHLFLLNSTIIFTTLMDIQIHQLMETSRDLAHGFPMYTITGPDINNINVESSGTIQ